MRRTLARLGISAIVLSVPLLAATGSFSFQTVIHPAGVAFTQLLGINNASKMATATAVAEPGSLTLILIGTVLAGMSFIKLRKKRE